MECPNCKNKLELAPNNAFRNVETYGTTNKVVTLCCNTIIYISRKISFDLTTCTNKNILEDDWGNKLKLNNYERNKI